MTSAMIHIRAPRALAASWQGLQFLLGFRNGHNFLLWCFLALGLLGFTLSRAPYLDYYGVFCKRNSLAPILHAAPGECFFFLNGGQEQIGMMMHLYAIIPCCLLLFFQFVPVIRQKAVLFHRINGYVVILLMAVALAGGLMATSNSFGGEVAFQVANVLLGASVTICLALAMISIRRLRIDQHRAWMLRAWVLASSIITMRIIQNIAGRAVSGQGYTSLRPCGQINSDGVLPQPVIESVWPGCVAYFTGASPEQQVLVRADYYGLPIEINVALSIASGASAFIALFLHAMGVEVYLQLTPAESERLRQVSYRKQSARGHCYSVRAGPTTADPGDATKLAPHDDGKCYTGSDSISEKSFEAGSQE
ncbi:hypothetical protein DHEL01_v200046 [Diaporthe helianthi]|uniref:DUF2306 domain-containing protein n=1 Tax=Diaporthe helianthi TaxID=158607 RepID=A0A2P5IG93_DIAHE|nr:hypothetical protein DHEL01_v200046 [Diaporthe helianthi]